MRLLPALGSSPRSWGAQHIREVIIAQTKRASLVHVRNMASAVRGYLRLCQCRGGLEHAVPIIAQWRPSTLPRYIEVERVIATCDPSSPCGLRHRAIPLVLARLGLRAGDIVSLRLRDLD
jgi:integrase/recombinase XerD